MVSIVLVASACSGGSREVDAPESPAIANGAGGYVQEYGPGDRALVDDFEGELLGGGRTSSDDLVGRVTVVNVWGSWCAPCRAEAPVLRAAHERYEQRGVRFLGLNVRDNDAAARAFEKRFEIGYPSVTSADSPRVSLAFGGLLSASAVPTTLMISADRRVAARVTGEVSAATLRALIDTTLGEER